MVTEYIDRKAFKDEYLCCGYLPEMSEEEFDVFPTVDAVLVVHGKRLEKEDYMFCSVCGHQWNYCDNDTQEFNYCPNCGARLDEEG